jgi:DNA damage-inducible protein 1
MRLQLLGNPVMRQEVETHRPELGAAIDDPQRFAQVWQRMADEDSAAQNQRNQHIADLNADPFDIDAQMKIAEMIREERVQENLQNAIEHNPEGKKHPRYPRVLLIDSQYSVEFTCSTSMSK